jgi:alkanesulfonate monooxygenase SsuD/methylene tetrahydromethanopterin reductase-like flavin-dependent oxidoreductase (luciferase family)
MSALGQVPVNDRFGAIPAMTAVTFEQSYILARRLSTLDHSTKGRVAGRGRQFASRHAEGMFILTTSIAQARATTNDIRDQAEKQGRSRDSMKIFTLLTVITGDSDEAAERKYQKISRRQSSSDSTAHCVRLMKQKLSLASFSPLSTIGSCYGALYCRAPRS